MITVAPGGTFEAVTMAFAASATVGVRIRDNQGNDSLARTTVGISTDVTVGTETVRRREFTAPNTSGQYTIVWDDGTTLDIEELLVSFTALTPLTDDVYVTPTELKNAINLAGQTYADDDIDRACSAASRGIDWATSQFFYSATGTRYYTAERAASMVETDPIQSITQLSVDLSGGNTYTNSTQDTDYWLHPNNAVEYNRPYERVELRRQAQASWGYCPRGIKIEGTFGWAEVPSEVRQFAMFFATRLLYRTRHAPFGIVLVSGDVGAVGRLARTDPDFEALVGGLVRSRPFF